MNTTSDSEVLYDKGCCMIREIIDSGHAPEEIAKELFVSPTIVSNWYFHISNRFKRTDTFEMISILYQLVMEEKLAHTSVLSLTSEPHHNLPITNTNTFLYKS